ncbi:MAG: S53 family peptidase, partial [Candidatus Acidiferrales bacterium]
MERHTHVSIEGSEYVPIAGATVAGPSGREERIQVTVVVHSRTPTPALHEDRTLANRLPRDRNHATREEFETQHGAHLDDLRHIEDFARARGFKIIETSAAKHCVVLQGSIGGFCEAFGVEMVEYEHERGRHRGLTGGIRVPVEIAGIVRAVLGLDTRPFCSSHVHTPGVGITGSAPFTPSEIAELYRFPRHADGAGQCIGVIELGGGYYREDLDTFFSSIKQLVPKITDVSVSGAENKPSDRVTLANLMEFMNSANESEKEFMAHERAAGQRKSEQALSTVETTMDIELVGSLAPGAHIVMYFAPNDEQGIYHALATAIADKQHRPSVISLSWGEPESAVSHLYMGLINDVLKNAASLGVTLCVSSGDYGARNQSRDGKVSVNFPASSPYVLSCGGTTLKASGKEIESEVVWNSIIHGIRGASGGGVSHIFDRPHWQENFNVPHSPTGKGGRGVPDVAGPADPRSGCKIHIGGVDSVSCGTSAVAPLWAALVARLNHSLGKPTGYLNSLLYQL